MLKSQDVVIVLKLAAKNAAELPWNFASLARELCMSSSEVHAGFQRAVKASLINPHTRQPNISALYEFIIHGLRYVFPPERGEVTRGVPTAHAADPLKRHLLDDGELPPVWPDPKGKVRGQAFLPLYKSVPKAAEMIRGCMNFYLLSMQSEAEEPANVTWRLKSCKSSWRSIDASCRK